MVLLLAASSAIAQDVRYNFDGGTNFEKFKTYKWVEIKGAEKVDELKDTEIKNALDAKLVREHLTKTDADTADLCIGYQAAVRAEKQFTSYNIDWGYGPGWYREGWFGGFDDHFTKVRRPPSTGASWRWTCMTRKSTIWCGAASSVRPSTPQPHPTSKNRASTNQWPSSLKSIRLDTGRRSLKVVLHRGF